MENVVNQPKRLPAGRKKKDKALKSIPKPAYATPEIWEKIQKKAQAANMEVSPYLIKSALEA